MASPTDEELKAYYRQHVQGNTSTSESQPATFALPTTQTSPSQFQTGLAAFSEGATALGLNALQGFNQAASPVINAVSYPFRAPFNIPPVDAGAATMRALPVAEMQAQQPQASALGQGVGQFLGLGGLGIGAGQAMTQFGARALPQVANTVRTSLQALPPVAQTIARAGLQSGPTTAAINAAYSAGEAEQQGRPIGPAALQGGLVGALGGPALQLAGQAVFKGFQSGIGKVLSQQGQAKAAMQPKTPMAQTLLQQQAAERPTIVDIGTAARQFADSNNVAGMNDFLAITARQYPELAGNIRSIQKEETSRLERNFEKAQKAAIANQKAANQSVKPNEKPTVSKISQVKAAPASIPIEVQATINELVDELKEAAVSQPDRIPELQRSIEDTYAGLAERGVQYDPASTKLVDYRAAAEADYQSRFRRTYKGREVKAPATAPTVEFEEATELLFDELSQLKAQPMDPAAKIVQMQKLIAKAGAKAADRQIPKDAKNAFVSAVKLDIDHIKQQQFTPPPKAQGAAEPAPPPTQPLPETVGQFRYQGNAKVFPRGNRAQLGNTAQAIAEEMGWSPEVSREFAYYAKAGAKAANERAQVRADLHELMTWAAKQGDKFKFEKVAKGGSEEVTLYARGMIAQYKMIQGLTKADRKVYEEARALLARNPDLADDITKKIAKQDQVSFTVGELPSAKPAPRPANEAEMAKLLEDYSTRLDDLEAELDGARDGLRPALKAVRDSRIKGGVNVNDKDATPYINQSGVSIRSSQPQHQYVFKGEAKRIMEDLENRLVQASRQAGKEPVLSQSSIVSKFIKDFVEIEEGSGRAVPDVLGDVVSPTARAIRLGHPALGDFEGIAQSIELIAGKLPKVADGFWASLSKYSQDLTQAGVKFPGSERFQQILHETAGMSAAEIEQAALSGSISFNDAYIASRFKFWLGQYAKTLKVHLDAEAMRGKQQRKAFQQFAQDPKSLRAFIDSNAPHDLALERVLRSVYNALTQSARQQSEGHLDPLIDGLQKNIYKFYFQNSPRFFLQTVFADATAPGIGEYGAVAWPRALGDVLRGLRNPAMKEYFESLPLVGHPGAANFDQEAKSAMGDLALWRKFWDGLTGGEEKLKPDRIINLQIFTAEIRRFAKQIKYAGDLLDDLAHGRVEPELAHEATAQALKMVDTLNGGVTPWINKGFVQRSQYAKMLLALSNQPLRITSIGIKYMQEGEWGKFARFMIAMTAITGSGAIAKELQTAWSLIDPYRYAMFLSLVDAFNIVGNTTGIYLDETSGLQFLNWNGAIVPSAVKRGMQLVSATRKGDPIAVMQALAAMASIVMPTVKGLGLQQLARAGTAVEEAMQGRTRAFAFVPGDTSFTPHLIYAPIPEDRRIEHALRQMFIPGPTRTQQEAKRQLQHVPKATLENIGEIFAKFVRGAEEGQRLPMVDNERQLLE